MNKTVIAVVSLFVPALFGVEPEPKLRCEADSWQVNDLATYCEIRETSLPFTGSLNVNASENGAILVTGRDQTEVSIRQLVHAAAPSRAEAIGLAAQVQSVVDVDSISAAGPRMDSDHWWSISYEIALPRAANLALRTANGAISITSVNGRIRYEVKNGAVALDAVGGDVEGRISSGALAVQLAGERWDGKGLNATVSMGAISVKMPAVYSAHFELSTKMGSIRTDTPLKVVRNGLFARSASGDVGAGGATIRAATSMGSISAMMSGKE